MVFPGFVPPSLDAQQLQANVSQAATQRPMKQDVEDTNEDNKMIHPSLSPFLVDSPHRCFVACSSKFVTQEATLLSLGHIAIVVPQSYYPERIPILDFSIKVMTAVAMTLK